ncbi:PAS domain S-box protein [Mesorhizobium sp. BAC0120]|nr:PAS domain S-box protein [Mesorhizobium sp. BAC0120]MDW6022527.1 PAS domain S-box protein [Mesorhizobium sp. BAC0120]
MLPAEIQIVIFWGPDFVALYNDAYAPTIGDKHPRALGRPARENWSELWSDLEPLLQHVLRTGETVSAKDRPFYIERHGYPENVHFDISYSAVRNEAGAVQGVFCIVNETTGEVLAKAALRENEERLRAIFSQATGGIALTDTDGRFVLVNQRFCEILGYTEADLLHMRMQEITHPDDLTKNSALFRQMLEEGTGFVVETRYVRNDGSYIWVSSSIGAIRDTAGKVHQAVATVIDIEERKRAEEVERRLAAIIASSDDAILSTDLNMTITSWNVGAERLYGYSASEAVGRPVTILVPDDRPDEEPMIIEQIRRGQRVEPHDTKRRRKDGSLVDVSLTVSPIRDEHDRIIGASKIARDITERKEAERLQRVLMGELKHRVKNVLATVQAIARQTFGNDNKEAREAFDARLLSMSRAHDLLTRDSWDGAELSAVVTEAIAPYQREHFEVSGPEVRLPPRVALALSLALHELGTNAGKYGALSVPTGKVTVSWRISPAPSPHLELRWQEQGGPTVVPPTRRGFGSRLIERVLAMELNGKVQIAYPPAGVVCDVSAPFDVGWDTTAEPDLQVSTA